jgi:hypothetical protein
MIKRTRGTLLVSFPALFVYGALRLALPEPGYSMLNLPGVMFKWWAAHPIPLLDLVPFGVLPVLALLDWRRNVRVLALYAPMLVIVYAQLLVAGDVGRLVVYGFPPFVIMATRGVERIVRSLAATRCRIM